MSEIDKNKKRLNELMLQKVEIERTLPAHSVPVSFMVELEDIEDEITVLERKLH